MKDWSSFSIGNLLLIVVLGAVLALLMVPNYSSGGGNAKTARAKSDVAVLRIGVDQFKLDCGRYPTKQEGLSALFSRPNGLSLWNGPYVLQKIQNDPWGNGYIYVVPGPNGRSGYSIESYGADGEPGGEGDNADIVDGAD